MDIGTFAREDSQVTEAIKHKPDFIDLRMDLDYRLTFREVSKQLTDEGIYCTLHLPSSPEWRPQDISREIVPFIDIGADIDAKLVTFHTALSSIFYPDTEIDQFLQSVALACDAAHERGVTLAVENLGLFFTELVLLFDICPRIKISLDIGHAQILAYQNRAISIIRSFFDRIEMVNVHDNNGSRMIKDLIGQREKRDVSHEEIRDMGVSYDLHLPIGEGEIDFQAVFRDLKENSFDGRFLMMCNEPGRFAEERTKFEKVWLEA
ncbi:MAG: sugar phosphate isomerase/epimerase [Candidatus Thorarchaeota archaeon]|nr:MAG: sugar phosphate isomerase/epimerase [Candidatus Thorarchaeota archaeon]